MSERVLIDTPDMLLTRPQTRPATFSLLERMRVEKGSVKDWEALHELHYKADGEVFGAHYWRVMLDDQLIAVMLIGVPRLILKPRHMVFPNLKPGAGETTITNVYRGKWVSKNLNLCSRIVVDTMFRSVGVSYRFLNIACRMEGKRFTEIQSSMSKRNPFAMRAGFKMVKLSNPNNHEKGVAFLNSLFDSAPYDHEAIMCEFDAMPDYLRQKADRQMREWYYAHSTVEKTGGNRNRGTGKVDSMPIASVLKQIQQLTFASPMYGVFKNPDFGRELPDSIPLLAFDNQKPTEPLRLDLL